MTDSDKLIRRMNYFKSLVKNAIEITGLCGKILDVGCGPGTSTNILKELLPKNTIFGIDINSDYINIAISQYPEINFKNIDCYSTPFEDCCFDSCFALNLFEVLAEPVEALKEIKRITKRGGIICVIDVDYRNIVVKPQIIHLKKLQRINSLLKRRNGFDPYVGSKLVDLFSIAGLQNVHGTMIRIDNISSDGFENTLLYDDDDKDYLIKSGFFTTEQISDMFTEYNILKKTNDFVYAIDYNLVYCKNT